MDTPSKNGMSNPESSNDTEAAPGEWTKPQAVHIPEATYMPAVLALGIVCMLWGIVTTYLITLVGVVLFVVAISGWIGELRHEHGHPGDL